MPYPRILVRVAVMALCLAAAPAFAQSANMGFKQVISTPNAPEAIGPYSQAIRAGKMVFLAGQIAIDPKTKQLMKDAEHRGPDPARARQSEGGARG